VQEAQSRKILLPESTAFNSVTGRGVRATVDGHTVAVGSARFLTSETNGKIDTLDQLDEEAAQLQSDGQTVFFASVDGQREGLLAISDPVKSSTRDSVLQLLQFGLQVVMLTGDDERTAGTIAKQLGIEDFEAALAPEDKLSRIEQLRLAGHNVAMAGDGINDAPALAAANVGIAMGTGTDVAIEAVGITLVGGDLRGLVRAIHPGRRVMRNIRQNLVFAFGYNMLGIPIAAGVLYPFSEHLLLSPMIAAAAMSCSCLSVVGNALRLRSIPLS